MVKMGHYISMGKPMGKPIRKPMGKPMGKPMVWDIHISGNPHVMFCVYIVGYVYSIQYTVYSIQYTVYVYIYICRICRWMKEAMFG